MPPLETIKCECLIHFLQKIHYLNINFLFTRAKNLNSFKTRPIVMIVHGRHNEMMRKQEEPNNSIVKWRHKLCVCEKKNNGIAICYDDLPKFGNIVFKGRKCFNFFFTHQICKSFSMVAISNLIPLWIFTYPKASRRSRNRIIAEEFMHIFNKRNNN